MTIILIIALLFVIILWVVGLNKLKATNEANETLNNTNKGLLQRVTDLENKNSTLNKYQDIIDIETKSKEIIAEANKIAGDTIQESKNIVSKANEIASSTKESASQYANEQKKKQTTF
jgi:biopolymer transport protein ExbB/TolQ